MSEHPGLEFAPPNTAFPNFTLDAPSSVIHNLDGTYSYRYLPLTNCDAMLLTKSFAPLVFIKKYGFLVFGTKSSRKNSFFPTVDAGTCKNEKMFLLTGKSCETFKYFVVLPG